jgi:hypothetical protein
VQRSRFRQISRFRWPLLITLVVSVTAAFSLSPLVNLNDPTTSVRASLVTSVAYDVIAPVSSVLDSLTLLTPSQYWATFGFCGLVFLVACWARRRQTAGRRAILTLARNGVQFVAGSVAVVGVMLVVTRPMASLHLNDPDLVAVDFHSHTSASHDGRADFDSEKNREWHRGAGFDVAYITDHMAFAGALDASERNPSTAGTGVVLLPGVELRGRGEHPILLGIDPLRTRITSPDLSGAVIQPASARVPPVLLLSIPGSVENVPAAEANGPIRLAGIEESDGCPRGLAQSERERDGIVRLARRLHLSLLSGSDNHGWGRAAAAWTVLRIPGWQTMTPSALDAAIRLTLIENRQGFSDVIARRTATTSVSGLAQAFGGVGVAVMFLRTMNASERCSWVAWGWLISLVSMIRARRSRRGLRLLVRGAYDRRTKRPLIEVAAALEAAS